MRCCPAVSYRLSTIGGRRPTNRDRANGDTASLMTEHQQRVRHLMGAQRPIGDRVCKMTLRRNGLRQEEITEEIELILFNRPVAK